MNQKALLKIAEIAGKPDAIASTISYLADKLHFVKKGEKVLILFSRSGSDRIGALLGEAVVRREAEPIFWEEDYRWSTLLRLAFSERVSTIMGPPLIVLGLSKLAKYRSTPLGIRNVVIAGYPCVDWMIDGINKGFDCTTWGCFDPGAGSIVCGFSCGKSRGVHLREEEYDVQIVDAEGNTMPDGEIGQIVIRPRGSKNIRYCHGETGRIERTACSCGENSPRLMDIAVMEQDGNEDVGALSEYLHSWTSILDCHVERGPYGMELEMVIFPGEQLPKLPTCAKQVVRPWDPETDKPLFYMPKMIKPLYFE